MKKDCFAGCGVAIILAVIAFGWVYVTLGESHQDVVCYSDTGIILMVENDVTIYRSEGRLTVELASGKKRVFVSGSCEFAPHDPEREYPPEDIKSWKGEPGFKGVRNA